MKTIANTKIILCSLMLGLLILTSCSSNDDTAIQEEQTIAIPDTNFEQALIDANIDTNGLNGNILKTDAEMVETLSIQHKEISNMQGIEGFINLKYLYVMDNLLTSLNISNNTALLELDFSLNQISNIDISNNVDLEYLEASDNQLSDLDISSNTALKELFCDYNQITDLITGTNTALEYISCEANQIANLDVSAMTSLTSLYCKNNQIVSLDLSNNTILKALESNNNQLESLNIKNGNNTNVTFFNVRNNPNLYCITVDDQGYSAASWFDYDTQTSFSNDCSVVDIPDANFEQALIDEGYDTNGLNGNITKVDAEAVTGLNVNNKNISNLSGIEAFINIILLNVSNNQLTTLNLTANTLLQDLTITNNELSTLNIEHNTALRQLHGSNNKLTGLNLSSNTNLYRLILDNNQLVVLNVKNGNNSSSEYINTVNNPNLGCIEVDNEDEYHGNFQVDAQVILRENCGN